MNSKNDRRVYITKLLLREALLGLMKEKSISKITPTELCRKADINRNTFYAHYNSPAELLKEIEEELYRDIMGCMTEIPGEGLHLFSICHSIKEHADLCTVICSNYGDSEFLYRLIASACKITIDKWRTMSLSATEAELQSYFTYCANGSVAVIKEWLNNGMNLSCEEVASILEKAAGALLSLLNSSGRIENK